MVSANISAPNVVFASGLISASIRAFLVLFWFVKAGLTLVFSTTVFGALPLFTGKGVKTGSSNNFFDGSISKSVSELSVFSSSAKVTRLPP